jgi:exodeoxyribonuclease-5
MMNSNISKATFFNLFDKTFEHSLTEDQRNVRSGLFNFVFEETGNRVFILRGYAGTGKTSIVGSFVKCLTQLKLKTKLLAPTGRAAKVFSQKAKKEAFTIHKQIYRSGSDSGEVVKLSLMPNLHTNTLFIVDEASMIANDNVDIKEGTQYRNLLEDLINYIFSGKDCFLMFVGDEGQLPPVGSDFSPALDVQYLNHFYPRLNCFTFALNQVVRQTAVSGILNLSTSMRMDKKIDFQSDTKDFKDVSAINGLEFQDLLENAYHKSSVAETIIITRSNKRANAYNEQIRRRLLFFDEVLNTSDSLMVVKNSYFWLPEKSSIGFIANGELLNVKRVLKYEYLYNTHFARLQVEFIDYADEEPLELLVFLDALNIDAPALPRTFFKTLFFEIEKDYLHEKNKKKRYDLILKNQYFNALQVKYAYAVTCHKSQGGQWENVFVDGSFLAYETPDESSKKWLYTAFTRASNKLFLINFPDNI